MAKDKDSPLELTLTGLVLLLWENRDRSRKVRLKHYKIIESEPFCDENGVIYEDHPSYAPPLPKRRSDRPIEQLSLFDRSADVGGSDAEDEDNEDNEDNEDIGDVTPALVARAGPGYSVPGSAARRFEGISL